MAFDGKVFIRVLERPYPRGGVTHGPGSILPVPEAAVEHVTGSNPPFGERIPDEEAREAGLPEIWGLSENEEEGDEEEGDEDEDHGDAPDPGGYSFTPAALSTLQEEGLEPAEYDGPATGAEPGRVLLEDVEGWLSDRS